MSTSNHPLCFVLLATVAACFFLTARAASAAEPGAETEVASLGTAATAQGMFADARRLRDAWKQSRGTDPSEIATADGCHGLRRVVPGAHLPDHACRLLVAEAPEARTVAPAHASSAPEIATLRAWLRSWLHPTALDRCADKCGETTRLYRG
jgi:hypothetical protein